MDKDKGAALILLGLGFLPIWRSGLRENLNFYQFIINHTIWGPEVEYIPEEMLTAGETEGIYMEIR